MSVRANLDASARTTAKHKQSVDQYQILQARLIETSCAELRGLLQQAAEANPLLEIDEAHELFTVGTQVAGTIEDTEGVWGRGDDAAGQPSSRSPSASLRDIAHYAAAREEGVDYRIELRLLVHQHVSSARERSRVDDILDALDDRGYFGGNPSIIAAKNDCSEEEVNASLALVQSLFHNGIGARDVSEAICLCLDDPEDRDLAKRLLSDSLHDIQAGRFAKIAREHEVSQKRVTELLRRLAECPAPDVRCGANEAVQYLYPDIVARTVDGELDVQIVGKDKPPLRVSGYAKLLDDKDLADQDRAYIEAKVRDASRFIAALNGRTALLSKFALLLGQLEHDFLMGADAEVVPLAMERIAEQLNVSASTISRMCKNKYIQTDRGSFPLGFFFMKNFSTIDTADGQQKVHGDYIARAIVEIVAGEDPEHPLSDQQIVEAVASLTGMRLARRTVAKYRVEACIPNSVVRRNAPRLAAD